MKTREEIEQEYERDSRAIWEDYKTKTRVLITNRNDNLHAAEVRRDAALAEAALAELDDPMLRLIAAAKEMPIDHSDNHGYLHFPGISPIAHCADCTAVVELRDAIAYAEQRRAQG